MDKVKIIDNFCPMYFSLLKEASEAAYSVQDYGGTKFPGISKCEPDWIKKRLGPVDVKLCFFRKYSKGVSQPTYIHEDSGVAEYSGVLCLGHSLHLSYGSLAFWQQNKLQTEWNLVKEIELIPNRCVIFPSYYPHSRLPRDWKESHDRVIQVFFFNRSEHE